MTTLAQNTTINLTLQDRSSIVISSNGGIASVTQTPTGGAATTKTIGPVATRETFGPFSEGALVTISNQTAVLDYDIPGGNVATFGTDSAGNVTGLVGPGGVTLRFQNGKKYSLAGFGDSITSLCQAISASTKYLQSYGYIPWALVLSKQACSYPFTNNFGVGGDTTTMIRARIASVLAAAPDICVVHGGTNDIYSGVSYATTIDNLANIWSALTGAGITVIAVPILPRAKDSTAGLLPLAQRYQLQRINAWIRATAPAIPNVYLADPEKNIVDYSATGSNLGDPIGGISAAVTAYTYDGLHPANLGGYWMGKAIADVLALFSTPTGTSYKSPADLYDATNNPNGNVLVNGNLSGSVGSLLGTTTGTSANSWTLQGFVGPVAGSQTAFTLPNGATQSQQTITIGASATAKFYQQRSALGGLSPGDTVFAEAEITVTSSVNLNSIFLNLDDGTTTTRCLNPVVNSYFPSVGWTGVLRTPEFVLGASATITAFIQAQTQAGGSAVIDVRSFNVRKVP